MPEEVLESEDNEIGDFSPMHFIITEKSKLKYEETFDISKKASFLDRAFSDKIYHDNIDISKYTKLITCWIPPNENEFMGNEKINGQ
ncbi:hypothetical protein FQR65_LT09567 [Abscondita terminalis]|nr:hypothetical protein FQR65_LT09567 [Abscondita terminalis]